ncbi:MAG: LicD family protein [Candidatus Krumholzibacteria bacterium]|nr:LicD family protein [Candidatus Krumholzibacteria bacterium]
MNLFRKISRKKKSGMDAESAFLNIVEARDILARRGVNCWLTDGTLLGIYRGGDFIRHDEDLDFGAFIEDFDDRLILDFTDNGWKLYNIFGRRDCGLELSFRKRGIKLDIFFFYREGSRVWHGAWRKIKEEGKAGRNLIKYYYDGFERAEIEFRGERFGIPGDTEKYLATKYGPGWRAPIRDWDWQFGPSNAVRTDIVI